MTVVTLIYYSPSKLGKSAASKIIATGFCSFGIEMTGGNFTCIMVSLIGERGQSSHDLSAAEIFAKPVLESQSLLYPEFAGIQSKTLLKLMLAMHFTPS